MARTLLIYGDSGTYKSSNLGELAEYLFERYGLISRLITADSGVSPMQEQIDRGVIIHWDLTTAKNPMGLFKKALRGYWPDKLVKGKADEGTFRLNSPAELSQFGGYFIEGLTRIADVMMQDLRDKRRDTGEPLQAKFEDGGVSFAQASRGTYGFVQTYTQDWVGELKALPVPWVIVTAHEGKGEDGVSKKTIFGPAIVGKAATDKVCGWFENSVHCQSYTYTVKGEAGTKEGVQACFMKHADVEVKSVYWPAKLGIPTRAMAGVLRKYPLGYVPLRIDKDGVYTSGIHSLVGVIEDELGVPRVNPAGETGVVEVEEVVVKETVAPAIAQEAAVEVEGREALPTPKETVQAILELAKTLPAVSSGGGKATIAPAKGVVKPVGVGALVPAKEDLPKPAPTFVPKKGVATLTGRRIPVGMLKPGGKK